MSTSPTETKKRGPAGTFADPKQPHECSGVADNRSDSESQQNETVKINPDQAPPLQNRERSAREIKNSIIAATTNIDLEMPTG